MADLSGLLAYLGLGDPTGATPTQPGFVSRLQNAAPLPAAPIAAQDPTQSSNFVPRYSNDSGTTNPAMAFGGAVNGNDTGLLTPSLLSSLTSGIDPGTGAPMGFGAPSAMPADPNATAAPQIVPTSAQGPSQSSSQIGAPDITIAPAASAPDVTVNADGSSSDGNPPNVGATGGLLASLAPAIPAINQAAQDPDASKGLLGALGDKLSKVGSSLTSLSPAASQGLLATGLSILANNNGQNNLSQLVGAGGIAGINQYNDVRAQQGAIALKQAELQQTAYQQAQANAVARGDLAVKQNEANKPILVNGTTYALNPATGQYAPVAGTTPAVDHNIDVMDSNGNVYTQGYDAHNNPVGASIPKTLVNTGPLTGDQFASVNAANAQAATSAAALQKTNTLLSKVTPTIPDPNNPGATIPNPNYVPMTSGVAATVGNAWNNLFGDQSQGQQVRNEITSTIRSTNMQQFKGIGKFDNMDMIALQKGMPPENASADALNQYLTAYGHLQQAQAINDQTNAAYVTANRGSTAPLTNDTTIGGVTYPAGTSYQAIMTGTATPKQQPQQPQQSPINAIPYATLRAAALQRGLIK